MVRFKRLLGVIAAGFLAAMAIPSPTDGATKARVAANYGKLPLIFEANRGQTDARVKFLARGPGYTLFLTPGEAVLSLRGADGKGHALRVKLLGAEAEPKMTGLDRLPGISNYFIGRDRSKWRTGVPHYAKVGYEGVYPGIDLVFYGTNQRQLEYDFVVAPGADPARIRLAIEGAKRLEIAKSGDLIAHLAGGEVRFKKPVIYQEANGKRRSIAGKYTLAEGNRIGFEIAAYDRAKPLVIDPMLEYATYLGGTEFDDARGVAVDADGNAHVVGMTSSADFPVTDGAFEPLFGGGRNGFVTKLNATGKDLIYSTYLGASTGNMWDIALDAAGNAYVTGDASTDLPTTDGAFQKMGSGSFVMKLDPTGSKVLYASYIDSSGGTDINAIAVKPGCSIDCRIYLSGAAGEVDFSVAGDVVQPVPAGAADAFVAIINPAGNGLEDLEYFTYLGGSGRDEGWGIAVDPAGDIYVVGRTFSNDFPVTATAFDQNCGNDLDDSDCSYADLRADAFLAKIDPTAGTEGLVYATYLGGTSSDFARDVAVRPDCPADCNAYVTGLTTSGDFPTTAGAVVPNYTGGGDDIFVTVIDPDDGDEDPANDLVYSTFFGDGRGQGIAVDTNGNAYIAGVPGKGEIPIRDPLGPEFAGAFLAVIDPSGFGPEEGLLFSNPGASALAIALDSEGAAYMVARTTSRDFFTTEGAFQTKISEEKQRGKPSSSTPPADAFVVKIAGPFGSSDAVDPLNGAPIAVDDAYPAVEDTPLIVAAPGVLANDSDPDEDSLTARQNLSVQPANGTVTFYPDGSFTYTPNANFNGTDSFAYLASDGQSEGSANVTITVAPVEDAPVALDDTYFGAVAGVEFTVSAPGVLRNDTDGDGDALTAILVSSPPANGDLFALQTDGGFTYTAKAGFSGTDTFDYVANDGTSDSNVATVSIEVAGGDLHIGDLVVSDRLDLGWRGTKTTWGATIYVSVHDQSELTGSVLGAVVSGEWQGASGTEEQAAKCVTDFTLLTLANLGETRTGGWCTVSIVGINTKIKSVTYQLNNVTLDSLKYDSSLNHDPDGDIPLGGTSITVLKPNK